MAQGKSNPALKTREENAHEKNVSLKEMEENCTKHLLCNLWKRNSHEERTVWGEREVVKDTLPEMKNIKSEIKSILKAVESRINSTENLINDM